MMEVADELLQQFANNAAQMENASYDYGSPGDEKLHVRFEMHPHLDDVATRDEGRPRFVMVEYVKIMTPGDKDTIIHRPVREPDKQRFEKQYSRFKAGQSQSVGFPLSEWPQLTRAQVEELAYFKITTIEELAGISDGIIGRFTGLLDLRKKAQDYLALQKEQAPIEHLNAELKKRDEAISGLQAQVEQLLAINAEKAAKASKEK
jgi:hypothetical protein